MLGIGVLFAGKQTTTEEYFLAGRRMPWLVVGMSIFASVTSAVSYMGIPGTAYKENISLLILGFVSLALTPFLIYIFYPFYRALNVTTSYEYILHRYGESARLTVSMLFVLARLGWLGTVLYAPALALSVVSGIDLTVAILLMGVLAAAYTALGGLSAVLWTDLVQFVILVTGLVWVVCSLCWNVPHGVAGILHTAAATDHLKLFELRPSLFEMTAISVGVSYFLQLMQDFGTDQITVQRLMSVPTYGGMVRATIFNAFSDLFIVSLLLFAGLGLFAYYQTFPGRLPEEVSADRVLPYYIMHALPNGVSGLLITSIFAAAMSSMDSGINSVVTVLIRDLLTPFNLQRASDEQNVGLARWLTVAIGAFATGIAFYVASIEQILKASSSFLGLFGAPVLTLFLLGMLTRRTNFPGWLIGLGVAIPATIWVQHFTRIHFIYYFPFCFAMCAVATYPASLLVGRVAGIALGERSMTIWGRPRLAK